MQLSIEQVWQVIGQLYVELTLVKAENAALRQQLGPGRDGLPIHDLTGLAEHVETQPSGVGDGTGA